MGEIRVNDIIYGTSFASGVTCDDNETVQEKLSNAAYIDIENEEISEIPRGDCLYTTDIIDNLESESDTHVLSAKQGKILNEKIENGLHDVVDNLESTATDKALSANQGRILNEKIDNFDLSDFGLDMELTQVEYDNLRNLNQIDPQVTYFITDVNIDDITSKNFNGNISDFFSISKDYMIGDYCIFNNQLYEFIEDKPAGDWDETKVKTTTIKEKLNELSSGLKDCFQSVSNGKALVASAITGMGVETDATDLFEVMAENVENIKTGDDTSNATASAAEIAKGYTAWVKGQLVTGTAILIDASAGYVVFNASDASAGSDLTDGWTPAGAYSAQASPSTGKTDSKTVSAQTNNLISLNDVTNITISYRFVNGGSDTKYTTSSSITVKVKDTSGAVIASASAVNSSRGYGNFNLTIDTTTLTGLHSIEYILYSWGRKDKYTDSSELGYYKVTQCAHTYIDRISLMFN